jgi:creatinine amidohydrolase/Fe(II)-dependent formamide hydrolase-like protein
MRNFAKMPETWRDNGTKVGSLQTGDRTFASGRATRTLGATAITLVTVIPAGCALAFGRFPGRRLILKLTLVDAGGRGFESRRSRSISSRFWRVAGHGGVEMPVLVRFA